MWNRRELLGGLGVASATSILWALSGCRLPQVASGAQAMPSDTIRGWLRDAVSWLAPVFPDVHALAVSRRRTTAAIDALGAGVARSRFDGVVIAVRDAEGRREHASSALDETGVARVVLGLLGTAKQQAKLDFGGAPVVIAPKLVGDPQTLDDRALLARVDGIGADGASSRIIYAAGLLEIDDATTWSVAPDHDREQRIVHVRRTATRVAWNGTRPVVGEATVAWSGGIDDRVLTADELHRATTGATELMTPGGFPEGAHALLLDPSVAATAIDATARALFTAEAQRLPEVARRARGTVATAITLVDDPTAAGAYGGYAFDDAGVIAAPIVLVDQGKVVASLGEGRARRPGHLGAVATAPSHLRLLAGEGAWNVMLGNGFALEGGTTAVVDPSSDRIVLAAARAREYIGGVRTGRVFAEVELVGSLTALLDSVTDLSRATRTFGFRQEIDGEPTWRSVEAPFVQARGIVRARRT